MNQDQVLSFVRSLIAFAGGFAVGNGYITADQLTMISGIASLAVPLAWSFYAHTDSAKIKAVTALPDIRKIETVPNPANDAVKAAANDPGQPKITPARGA